jgi:endonuclease YncB( thermonuclease family)
VDGDTVILMCDVGFYTYREERFRLARINSKEYYSIEGSAATEFLTSYLQGKPLQVQSVKKDMYGRYVCELYALGNRVSDILVENGHAVYL